MKGIASQADESDVTDPKSEVPWKSLFLSFGLLIAGVVFWSLSISHMLGHFFSKDGAVGAHLPRLQCV